MIEKLHKLFMAGIYLAAIVGVIAWAYSNGPCDAESRARASYPVAR